MADAPRISDFDRAHVSLGEAVFRALSRALRAGVYRPGDRLREDEVAGLLGVSRTPVREAFGRLQAKRLVEPAGARGLIVRNLERTEVLELYAMREILEGAAARLAAQHATWPEIEALQDNQARFAATSSGPLALARLNLEFHEIVARAARNHYLDLALQDLQDSIALLGQTTFAVADRPTTAAPEHGEIIAAIVARDPERAEQAARRHIREALRARLKLAAT